MSELYYLQDKRQYVGNDILWWAKDGMGYTTDVSKAEAFTKEELEEKFSYLKRGTDIPWPKVYIDHITRPVVDMQIADYEIVLAGHPWVKEAGQI